jgi:hypothetical protein
LAFEHVSLKGISFLSTFRFFPNSWLITRFVTRLTRRLPLVEQ